MAPLRPTLVVAAFDGAPRPVAKALVEAFGIPVVEAYRQGDSVTASALRSCLGDGDQSAADAAVSVRRNDFEVSEQGNPGEVGPNFGFLGFGQPQIDRTDHGPSDQGEQEHAMAVSLLVEAVSEVPRLTERLDEGRQVVR